MWPLAPVPMSTINFCALFLALLCASVGVAHSLPASLGMDTLTNGQLRTFLGDPMWNVRLKSLIDAELHRRRTFFEPGYPYFEPMNPVDMPVKRYSRIGGTIVMG